MASRKPAVAAAAPAADTQGDPEMPDHDLEPPRFARRALERLLNDWPAVSAMLSTGLYRTVHRLHGSKDCTKPSMSSFLVFNIVYILEIESVMLVFSTL
jgi:hypothetical protein